jgi:G3E family GTPase
LKDKNESNLIIAPLSVLVDPERLINILEGGTSDLHKSAEYILQKQLEEADIILINKSDRLNLDSIEWLKKKAGKKWPMAQVLCISAKNGINLDDWLCEVTTRIDAGTHC